jgi:hypothetical protein
MPLLSLNGEQAVRDVLDRVREGMREVIQRIQAPRVTLAIMMRVPNPQQDRIAHDHVWMRHVDLRAEYVRTIGKLSVAHAQQQIEILVD